MNLGEEFGDAASREVFEETGIKCSFKSIVRLRHSHEVQGDRSDLYVICRMQYESGKIEIDDEIQDCKWMNVSDFLSQNKHPMHKEIMSEVSKDKEAFDELGWRELAMPSTIPGKREFRLYTPSPGEF